MIDKCKELAAYARSIRSRIIATILLAVFCAGTVFAAATASYTVTVVDDGQARSVITTRSDANAILEQAQQEEKTNPYNMPVGTEAPQSEAPAATTPAETPAPAAEAPAAE